MNVSERNRIRRSMRRRRRALSARERRHRSQALVLELVRSAPFQRARHIGIYLSNDGEVDLQALTVRAQAMGKRCYLPVLTPLFHNRLWFVPYHRETTLVRNRFGIPEPVSGYAGAREPWVLDLVLAPLVAFDGQGNRLGMGGGFYDRTFAYLLRREHWCKPRIVGTAFAFQQVEALPCAPWDVPMDGIVTDNGWLELGERTETA